MKKKIGLGLMALGTIIIVTALAKNNTPAPQQSPTPAQNDIKAATVMITTRSMDHGGTGLILKSTENESIVLTNDHVCKAIANGGVVSTENGQVHQINAYMESQLYDLCLLAVTANLNVNTNVSAIPPKEYDKAQIIGHPALLPTVITEGHVSGQRIIQVVTGFKECTEDDLDGPLGVLCMFFGGIPTLKSYEPRLVTATIMPGSSGSGVYNENKDLIGLVFAGSGDIGYAWTVPYEQVVNFLQSEIRHLSVTTIDQTVSLNRETKEAAHIREMHNKCNVVNNFKEWKTDQDKQVILDFCSIIKRDAVWRKLK